MTRNGGSPKSLVVSLKGYNQQTGCFRNGIRNDSTHSTRLSTRSNDKSYHSIQMSEVSPCSSEESTPRRRIEHTRFIRQTNQEKSRESKIRVIKMLFVMVIEFFICWTPLYTVQTWRSIHEESVKENMTSEGFSMIFVLCYISSCCNPITYCFMNTRFRQAFIGAIRKCFCCSNQDNGYMYRYTCSTHRLTYHEAPKLEETDLSLSDKSRG